MNSWRLRLLALLVVSFGFTVPARHAGASTVENGDANGDGSVDISDAVSFLSWLFLAGPAPVAAACPVGAPNRSNGDVNDDGALDVSDAVYILLWLFGDGAAPVEIRCNEELSACETLLCSLGIDDWERGPDSPGVASPVTVRLPLGGIRFRKSDGQLRDTFFMDCSLAVALHRAAKVLSAHGVVEVADFGIYNYRCIGGGTPPNCPNGISQHALAQALDIAAVVTAGGETSSVLVDWQIDPSGQTCAEATRSEKDALLHALACELHAAGIFNIVLTPNYNADHRNHLHLDLTPGASFIR